MKTIWKFPLHIKDEQVVSVPKGWSPLFADVQLGVLCIWAMVDSDAQKVTRRVWVHGTGHPIVHHGEYIGSAQMAGGHLVWHVFSEK